METLWFAIVSAMLAVYVVLDGFDFGVGILHRFVAKNDEERRTVLAAIAPVWDGNEVWLVGGGGRVVHGISQGLFRRLQWLLPGLDDRALAADPARHRDRIALPQREPLVAGVL